MRMVVVVIWSIVFSTVWIFGSEMYFNQPMKAVSALVKQYNHIARIETIGQSRRGVPIPTVIISKGKKMGKPALWIVGGVDPRLPSSVTYSFWLLEDLLKSYNEAGSPLQNYIFYVTPVAAPDVFQTQLQMPRAPRLTNQRETDDDRDGYLNEDGYDDLNGDGYITLMRVFTRNGQYRAAEVDSLLWRKVDRKKGEQGVFDLYWEGVDNDKDGQLNEDPPGGVNINQNFTFNYPYFKAGSGPHQVSEPESRALADFAFKHPNIVLVVTFSLNDNVVNRWPVMKTAQSASSKSQSTSARRRAQRSEIRQIPQEDARYFNAITRLFRQLFPEGWAFPKAEHPGGAFDRWVYFHYGRWVVSLPGWLLPPDTTKAGSASSGKTKKELKQSVYYHRLLQYAANKHWPIWVPWKTISHPDFPGLRVDIGGFYPLVVGNPPDSLLAVYRPAYQQFIKRLITYLPQLTVDKPKVKRLETGVYRVTLRIRNVGQLPTNTVTGSHLRWVQDVRVRFLLNGQTLIGGKQLNLLKTLLPDDVKKITAVVQGKSGSTLNVEIGSPTVGYQMVTIQLP